MERGLSGNNREGGFLFQYPVKSRQTGVPGGQVAPKRCVVARNCAGGLIGACAILKLRTDLPLDRVNFAGGRQQHQARSGIARAPSRLSLRAVEQARMSDDKRRIESVAHQPIRSLEAVHAQIIGSAVPQQHRFKQRDWQGMADEQDPCADRHPWGAGGRS